MNNNKSLKEQLQIITWQEIDEYRKIRDKIRDKHIPNLGELTNFLNIIEQFEYNCDVLYKENARLKFIIAKITEALNTD